MSCIPPERIMTTEAWVALHHAHGPFTTEDAGHPSGTWVRRVCPCGAAHTGKERGETDE